MRKSKTIRYAAFRFCSSVTLASMVSTPTTVFADATTDKKACVVAYEQSQEQRQQGRLRQAREQLLLCARPACPATIVNDCARWIDEVSASMPSVVIATVDDQGKEVSGGRVLLDGQLFVEKLDGRAREVDPGAHTFRYEPAQGAPVEQTVTVREGEKNRTLRLVVPAASNGSKIPAVAPGPTVSVAPTAVARPTASSIPPVWAYVAAGVGVVGLGVFALEGLSGKSDQNHLKETCSPRCSPDQTDPVSRKYLIADIGLGVGLVSLGVATWLFLAPPKSSAPTQGRFGGAPLASGGGYLTYDRDF